MNSFEDLYKKLNKAQKEAVDAVEGPVMVIAGPGTGKTHILTLRIANILKKTQANSSNILALTFTESAARTLRVRLAGIIGEKTAREVNIFTFHGFCQFIFQNHIDSFPHLVGKRLMGDVESVLLWREIFEEEEIEHLRTPKAPFNGMKDLMSLYGNLAREYITYEAYTKWAEEEKERILEDSSYRYVKGEKKGELNPKGEKKIQHLEKVYEAVRLMEAYDAKKDEYEVYDFSDILRSVVDGVKNDDALRSDLQEMYQYILADEHQDANAIQHALLDLFAYDDHPNIFVVGDEKQAIYRFQGADVGELRAFITKYPRALTIVLDESFRSLQGVLDTAHEAITETGTHNTLSSIRTGEASVELLVAPDPLAERTQVASLIEKAIADGTPPHEIAVISCTNSVADMIAQHITARNIPVLRAGNISFSSRPIMRGVVALMCAVADPLDTASLRMSLLAPWWGFSLEEQARLLRTTRDSNLLDTLKDTRPSLYECVTSLQKKALTDAPLELLSRILVDTGVRAYLLSHAEYFDDIALLRRFMMHVEEVVARDVSVSFAEVMSQIEKAEEHGIETLKEHVTQREGMVSVLTAHKAKGMEFEKVFIVGLTDRGWEKSGRKGGIPSPLTEEKDIADTIRLFYVALTRAKNSIILSYASSNGEGRDNTPSILIPKNLPPISPLYDDIPIIHTDVQASELIQSLTKRYLTEDGLSPSALKEYLNSPASFFARYVLRLKEGESEPMVIGTAVHAGIATYLETKNNEKSYEASFKALSRTLLPRNKVYENIVRSVRESLDVFLDTPTEGDVVAIEKSFSYTYLIDGENVLLSGKVDAVLGKRVIDFKTTGNLNAHDEEYMLQLAFYDLLLNANGVPIEEAMIVQVTPKEVTEHPIVLNDETRAHLKETLDTVVREMLTGKWRKGEPSSYDSLLTLFTEK